MLKKIVVTGAGGRLGGGVARRLKKEGRLLAGIDVAKTGEFVTDVVDLCSASTTVLEAAVGDADGIVHCAALPGPSATPAARRETTEVSSFIGLEDEAPVELLLKNVASTARLLETAARSSKKTLRRVVYSSSAFAMGWSHEATLRKPPVLPLTENDAPEPLETYGLSKWLGELVCELYARTSGIEFINLRFPNIVKRERFSELPWPYDPRLPLLMFDYCHEDDVVDAHLRALDSSSSSDTFLLAAPTTRFAESTTDLLARHFPTDPPAFLGGSANEAILDATEATRKLDWHPRSWTTGSKAALAARKDPDIRYFSLDGFTTDSGFELPSDASLAYRVYNNSPGKKLCVVGTSFGAVHTDLESLFGTTLSDEYAVVVFNLMGNGVSWSPSTAGSEKRACDNPAGTVTTVADNVRAQQLAFAADPELKGRPVDLCYGYSMGAMQALEWARTRRQEEVRAVAAVCGGSGCSDYNAVFLEALIHALHDDDDDDPKKSSLSSSEKKKKKMKKLRSFASIYAGWGVGPEFYRGQHWRPQFASLEDFLERSYGGGFADDEPDDLLAMVRTWRATPRFSPADLNAISARVLLVPCDTDTYFRVEDLEALEKAYVPSCSLRVIKSTWGHLAGNPEQLEAEFNFIKAELKSFLPSY